MVLSGLILTFTRNAWVVAAVATLLAIGYQLFFTKRDHQPAFKLFLILALSVSLLAVIFGKYISARLQFSAQDPALVERWEYNKKGVKLIGDHWWLGVGIGNQGFYAIKDGYYQISRAGNKADKWQPIHNLYILITTEIGIFGLLCFLVFLSKFLFTAKNPVILGTIGSLLLLGLMDHYLWTLQPGRLMLWLVIGILMTLCPRSSMDRMPPSEGGGAGSIPAEGTNKKSD